MREKCRRKGLPETAESALGKVKDAIGIRIVCSFVDDIFSIVEYIKGFEDCEIVKEKDYIRHAKPNGYRSYHIILAVKTPYEDVYGNIPGIYYVEMQIRTIAMDTWAALEHKMKYKKDIPNQELLVTELKRVADELASCDLSMQTIRDMIG
jgi:GTP pyrophosphokinase